MTNEIQILTRDHGLTRFQADMLSLAFIEGESPLKITFALKNRLEKIYRELHKDFVMITTVADEIPYACIYIMGEENILYRYVVSLASLDPERVEMAILMECASGKINSLITRGYVVTKPHRLD